MKYYGIDFGNSNLNIAFLDSDKRPLEPELISSEEIGFHYDYSENHILVPSCIAKDGNEYVIGTKAKKISGCIKNIKKELRKQSLEPDKEVKVPLNGEDIPVVTLCAEYFECLFKTMDVKFAEGDRLVFTIPSFYNDKEYESYKNKLEEILKNAIDNFDDIKVDFCDEALATAVAYRVFQSKEGFERDYYGGQKEGGFQRNILALDAGSFSSDVQYFETGMFHEIQEGKISKEKSGNILIAGSDIDKWIKEYLDKEIKDEALKEQLTIDKCEEIKISLSKDKPIDKKFSDYIDKEILDDIVKEKHFYAKLAVLCSTVLPERAKKDKTFLEDIYFLFTGGTSQLPYFATNFISRLWSTLYEGESIGEIPLSIKMRLSQAINTPFEACVKGAVWWLWLINQNRRFIPSSDAAYAMTVFEKDALIGKNVVFLKAGQDISSFSKAFSLVPYHNKQTFYEINIVKSDSSGQRDVLFIKGLLNRRKSIQLEFSTDADGKIIAKVDEQEFSLFYV